MISFLSIFSTAHIPAYLSVIGTCILKYLVGVILAYTQGFNFWELVSSIFVGGILSILLFTYSGSFIRKFLLKKFPPKTPNLRRALKWARFWRKYGIIGVSVISPIISPMLAVFIALAFREKPERIMRFMGTSLLLWSFLLAFFQDLVQVLWGTLFK